MKLKCEILFKNYYNRFIVLILALFICNYCQSQPIREFLIDIQSCEKKHQCEYYGVSKQSIVDSISQMPENSSNTMNWETGNILNINICAQTSMNTIGYFTGLGIWQYNTPFILDKQTKYLYYFHPVMLVGISTNYKCDTTTVKDTIALKDTLITVMIEPKCIEIETLSYMPERRNPFDLKCYRDWGFYVTVYDNNFTLIATLKFDTYYKKDSVWLVQYAYYGDTNDGFYAYDRLPIKYIEEYSLYQDLLKEVYSKLTFISKKNRDSAVDDSLFDEFGLFRTKSERIRFSRN